MKNLFLVFFRLTLAATTQFSQQGQLVVSALWRNIVKTCPTPSADQQVSSRWWGPVRLCPTPSVDQQGSAHCTVHCRPSQHPFVPTGQSKVEKHFQDMLKPSQHGPTGKRTVEAHCQPCPTQHPVWTRRPVNCGEVLSSPARNLVGTTGQCMVEKHCLDLICTLCGQTGRACGQSCHCTVLRHYQDLLLQPACTVQMHCQELPNSCAIQQVTTRW